MAEMSKEQLIEYYNKLRRTDNFLIGYLFLALIVLAACFIISQEAVVNAAEQDCSDTIELLGNHICQNQFNEQVSKVFLPQNHAVILCDTQMITIRG